MLLKTKDRCEKWQDKTGMSMKTNEMSRGVEESKGRIREGSRAATRDPAMNSLTLSSRLLDPENKRTNRECL